MNLVILTSIIDISNKPLSYSNIRSVYSKEERFIQTLNTIESIKRIPNSKVCVVENNRLDKKMKEELKSKVDFFLQTDDESIDSSFKSSGESTQILYALNNLNYNQYQNIYKISGRYCLNNNFDYEQYDNEHTIFFQAQVKNYVATVFYKINKKDFDFYHQVCSILTKSTKPLEEEFKNFFYDSSLIVDKLGIEGNVSVDGNFISW